MSMNKGVFGAFAGNKAAAQPKKILILGESHHWSKADIEKSEEERKKKEQNYRTKNVINNYLNIKGQDPCYYFFDKIVESFGFSKDDRESFWEKVFFANYVDDCLCGIGNGVAKKAISGQRSKYNDSLFSFINANQIDVVFCFSRLAFDSFPSLASKAEDMGELTKDITIRGKRDYIGLCAYMPHTDHRHVSVQLQKELYAYSMRHPSGQGGYEISNYVNVLSCLFSKYTK